MFFHSGTHSGKKPGILRGQSKKIKQKETIHFGIGLSLTPSTNVKACYRQVLAGRTKGIQTSKI